MEDWRIVVGGIVGSVFTGVINYFINANNSKTEIEKKKLETAQIWGEEKEEELKKKTECCAKTTAALNQIDIISQILEMTVEETNIRAKKLVDKLSNVAGSVKKKGGSDE